MNKLEDSSSAPEALPDWVIECLSRLFSSISDHTRIRIVYALTEADRLNVSEIAEHTGDSYDATRLILTELFEEFKVEGQPIVMGPTATRCW